MADLDDNANLAFLNLSAGDEQLCRAAFNDDGSGKAILEGNSTLLPNMLCMKLLDPNSRSANAQICQMAVHSIPYGDPDNLNSYLDIQKLTSMNTKQCSTVAGAKISEKLGYQAIEQLSADLSLVWSSPIAQSHFLGDTCMVDLSFGNLTNGAHS